MLKFKFGIRENDVLDITGMNKRSWKQRLLVVAGEVVGLQKKKKNNFWAVKQQYNNEHAKQQKHQAHRPAEAAWSGRAEW